MTSWTKCAVIVYLDSSSIARSYLSDEADDVARRLIDDPDTTTISGSWSRIEVTGALVRAERAGRARNALRRFESEIAPRVGKIHLVDSDQAELEHLALTIVRSTGMRSMDAWHLSSAAFALDALADPGEGRAFLTRDAEQHRVAEALGFTVL